MVVAPFLGLLLWARRRVAGDGGRAGGDVFRGAAFDLMPSICPAERRVRVKRLGIVCVVLAALCLVAALFVW